MEIEPRFDINKQPENTAEALKSLFWAWRDWFLKTGAYSEKRAPLTRIILLHNAIAGDKKFPHMHLSSKDFTAPPKPLHKALYTNPNT